MCAGVSKTVGRPLKGQGTRSSSQAQATRGPKRRLQIGGKLRPGNRLSLSELVIDGIGGTWRDVPLIR